MDIKTLAGTIFTKDPENPKTYDIGLESDDNLTTRDCFEFLLDLFTEGSKIKYGDENNKVDLTKWTENDIKNMTKYFNSMGFNIYINIFNNVYLMIEDYRGLPNDTPLDKFKFSLRCGTTTYVISFNYLS